MVLYVLSHFDIFYFYFYLLFVLAAVSGFLLSKGVVLCFLFSFSLSISLLFAPLQNHCIYFCLFGWFFFTLFHK
ncbi:hypothetical protein CYL31_12665 [Marinomonas sp. A3A]|nr:hypothetical protein CYL31_12665 [Marinomonas sp. A3A]